MMDQENRGSRGSCEADAMAPQPLLSPLPDLPPELSAECLKALSADRPGPVPPLPPMDSEQAECGSEAGAWAPPPLLPQSEPPARRRVNGWALLWAALAICACVAGKGYWQEAVRAQGKAAALRAGNQALQEKIAQVRHDIREREELHRRISELDGEIEACRKENAGLAEELDRYGRQESPMALRDQVQRLEREKDRYLRNRETREERAAQAEKRANALALKAPNPPGRLAASDPVAHGSAETWRLDPQGWEAGIRRSVSANFRARTNGDAELMRSIFSDAVCYQYHRYRTVSKECVMQDIVEGWDKWPVRRYELLQVGVNKDYVEIVFRYNLSNPATSASTAGYSKECWGLDEAGKIVLWEEVVSKKARPRLDREYRTIKMK